MTRRGSVLLGLLIALGTACSGSSSIVAPTPTTTTIPWRVPSGPLRQVVLTPDGSDHYDASTTGAGSLTVSAPASNIGFNFRSLFLQPDQPPTVDQQQCVTWRSAIDLSKIGVAGIPGNPQLWQPGIALRIANAGTVTKAIAIAQNVWAGGAWIFWVQMWDTGTEAKLHATVRFDLRDVLITSPAGAPIKLAAPPWHVCARVIADRLDFKLWTGRSAEPAFADPKHAFHARLPEDWVYPGRPGTYVGHLHPGISVGFTGITTAPARP